MSKLRRKPKQDKARARTEKQLEEMERNIGRVYERHSALIAVEKKYRAYMESVNDKVQKEYMAYQSETDPDAKAELKRVYTDKVESLTRKSSEYNKIVKEFVAALAQANQEAVKIVNAEMRKIYVENYNEVAEACRKAGIKVNG